MRKSLGQVGYERYLMSGPNPGRTYNDLPMPTWDDLGMTEAGLITRQRWEDSAQAIAAEVIPRAQPSVAALITMMRKRRD